MKKLATIILSMAYINSFGQAITPNPNSTVLFDEKFECSKFDLYGSENSVLFSNARTAQDDFYWTSALDEANPAIPKGVAARLDNMLNGYGAFSQDKKDFLTTGGLAAWGNNFKILAKLQSLKADAKGAAGLVYYKDIKNYRVCFVAVDEAPGKNGPVNISDPNSATNLNASNAILSIVEVRNGVVIGGIDNPSTVVSGPLSIAKFNSNATLNADKSYQLIFTQHDDGQSDCELKTNTSLIQVHYEAGIPVNGTARFALANFGNKVLATQFLAVAGMPDTDMDGVSNAEEMMIGTDPTKADSDGDFIIDREEVGYIYQNPMGAAFKFYAAHHTDKDLNLGVPDNLLDVLDLDSDNDGITDAVEAGDTNLMTKAKDTNCDGIPDFRDFAFPGVINTDPDMDGLPTDKEMMLGTDPMNPDTDGDGLKDGEEVNMYNTDPLKKDSDNDGLNDGQEVITHDTDPLDPDTDNGGVKDGQEVNADGTDPLNPADDKNPIVPGNGGNNGGTISGNDSASALLPQGVFGGGGCSADNGSSLLLFLGVGALFLMERRKRKLS